MSTPITFILPRGAIAALLLLAAFTPSAYAAHPLISDDSGTQGAGNWQLEVNTDHTRTRDDGQTAWARQLNTTLTRGVTDELDVAANLPLQRNSASGEPAQSGVADVTVQAKWRFYDNKQGWSLALRPAVTLPTGSDSKGLGNGRATAGATLISTLEAGDWTWLANAGYTFNDNRLGDRKHLWAASTALLYKLTEQWSLVADVGASRGTDASASRTNKFAVLGTIYHLNDKTDLDIGWRRSLGAKPVSNTMGVGLTLHW